MSRYTWALRCDLDGWLVRLAEGSRLPWIVEPASGHHGHYSIYLTREDEP
jgi:hypothetical protein